MYNEFPLRFIPIEEAMPPGNTDCLFIVPTGEVYQGRAIYGPFTPQFVHYTNALQDKRIPQITHWITLQNALKRLLRTTVTGD